MIFVQRRTDIPNPELVENGNFATDSDWLGDSNWSISSGKATSSGYGRMFQLISFLESNVGTTVQVTFEIVEVTNGGVVVNCYGGISQEFTTVGLHTFVTTTTNSTNLYFNNGGAGGGFIGSIDNVSVKLANPEIPKENELFVTISERLNLTSNKWLLLVFESDQQHTKSKTVLNANSSDVTLNERIDKLILTEGGNQTETTDGTVKISVAGFWQYKIYEQTSATNLDETSSDIQQLLEVGKMTVTDTDELTTVEHTNQVTNFIHLNS